MRPQAYLDYEASRQADFIIGGLQNRCLLPSDE